MTRILADSRGFFFVKKNPRKFACISANPRSPCSNRPCGWYFADPASIIGRMPSRAILSLATLAALATCTHQVTPNILEPAELSRSVLIRRTTYGVPHITARDYAGVGYGEAWVQIEDYGPQVAYSLLRARGEMGKYFGRDSMRNDFAGRLAYARAS